MAYPLHRARRVADVGQPDQARLVWVAGEGGVNFDPLAVGNDQERRVFEFERVVGELLE